MSGVGRRAVLAALAANLGVAAVKLVGFVITGSTALLAETLHSAADSGNQALLLLGGRLASEGPSPVHPFGRGRERFFWAFVVGLVLFGLGGVFSVVEGSRKLASGAHEVTSPVVAVVLIVVALVFELASLRTAVREANRIRPASQSWWRFVRRTRNPEVSVVLLEDTAAVAGLGVALAGVLVTWWSDDALWDGLATITIGALLCAIAALLTTEMKSLLIGETVPARVLGEMEAAIVGVDGVERVLNLRTEHLGPDEVLVCVKVAIVEPADLARVIAVVEAVERVVKASVPDTLTCYVEPDRYDADRVDQQWT